MEIDQNGHDHMKDVSTQAQLSDQLFHQYHYSYPVETRFTSLGNLLLPTIAIWLLTKRTLKADYLLQYHITHVTSHHQKEVVIYHQSQLDNVATIISLGHHVHLIKNTFME